MPSTSVHAQEAIAQITCRIPREQLKKEANLEDKPDNPWVIKYPNPAPYVIIEGEVLVEINKKHCAGIYSSIACQEPYVRSSMNRVPYPRDRNGNIKNLFEFARVVALATKSVVGPMDGSGAMDEPVGTPTGCITHMNSTPYHVIPGDILIACDIDNPGYISKAEFTQYMNEARRPVALVPLRAMLTNVEFDNDPLVMLIKSGGPQDADILNAAAAALPVPALKKLFKRHHADIEFQLQARYVGKAVTHGPPKLGYRVMVAIGSLTSI